MAVAFFDMDHTIIDGNSGTLYTRYRYQHGHTSFWEVARSLVLYLFYRLNRLDIEGIFDKYVAQLAGDSEAEMIAFCRQWFADVVSRLIFPEARQLIAVHQARGDLPVIISNSTQFIVEPMARHLEVEDFLCSRVEAENGIFTGKMQRPLCYGPGKLYWADAWTQKRGLHLHEAYFYTDSYSDLDLLEVVRYPVAVNPDAKLRRIARTRNWPIKDFKLKRKL